MPKGRSIGERITWDEERLDFMREIIPGHSEGEISTLFEERYGVPLTKGRISSVKAKLGINSGTTGGRFVKGQTSHNKGRKWADYMTPEQQERARATCFKKGNIPHTYRPGLGHTRADKRSGAVLVKVREHSEPGKPNTYELRSRVVWEQHNGPIPPGHVIRHADGDNTNDDIGNLRCVSQRCNRYLNQKHVMRRITSPETFDAMLHVAELTFAMVDAKKD